MLLACFLSTGCHRGTWNTHSVRLSGAQVPTELVQSWLRVSRNPGFRAEQAMPVYRSMDGFENLARGRCDLACTDRPITVRELEQFGGRGLVGRRVAFYAYGLYMHPDNPIDAIFAKHFEMVLQQEITDWSQLAGDSGVEWSGPIRVYGQRKSTRAGSLLSHMARIWTAQPTWEVAEDDAAVIAKVASDPLALGFAGVGHDGPHVRYLGLRMNRLEPPSFPSREEIESERYGLAKLVYVYHLDPPSPDVRAALDYLFSDAGAAAIEATGLWTIADAGTGVAPLP